MIPWVHLDTSPIPGEHDTMRLMRRGEEYCIFVGPIELMSNRRPGSEQALASLTCERLHDRPAPRILIGGLGMGFTLGTALETLGPKAEIVVAELVPAVAEWARGPLAHIFGGALDDPRVELRIGDVDTAIQSGKGQWDAILLDVDNGPDALTRRTNDKLYDVMGLRRARFALRPRGILAIWSGAPDRKFKARLSNCGFEVDERRVHAHGSKGRRHVLWLATRPDGQW